MVVGIDEAGRGPLAGVVVACALSLKEVPPFVVKDSKSLSASRREVIFSWLRTGANFGVGLADAKEIDEFNILEATLSAFNRAIKQLLVKSPKLKKATFIVDGNHFRNELKLNYICKPRADSQIKEVSCASIVAKVVRDHLMSSVDFLYPQWNFSQHKGYPTSEHFSLIKRYALTPFHRRSFAPCRKRMAKRSN